MVGYKTILPSGINPCFVGNYDLSCTRSQITEPDPEHLASLGAGYVSQLSPNQGSKAGYLIKICIFGILQ